MLCLQEFFAVELVNAQVTHDGAVPVNSDGPAQEDPVVTETYLITEIDGISAISHELLVELSRGVDGPGIFNVSEP